MAISADKLKAYAKRGKGKTDDERDDDEPEGAGEEGETDEGEGDEDEEGHEHDDEGEDVDVDGIVDQVANGQGDKRLMRLGRKVKAEGNPPQWVKDEAVWEKAKAAVEDRWDDLDEPYAVVTHIYDKMGGRIG